MRYLLALLIITSALLAEDHYDTDGLTKLTNAEVAALFKASATWKMAKGRKTLRTTEEESATTSTLAQKKTAKIQAITAKTESLNSTFSHRGKTFKLTMTNIVLWKALTDAVADDTVDPPIAVTASDGSEFSLEDKAAVKAFYSAGLNHILDNVSSGKALIAQVKAADKAGLDGITDTRSD